MLLGYNKAGHPAFRILSALLGLVCSVTLASAAGISLYAGRTSVAPGEALTIHVSTDLPTYDIRVYRFGAQVEMVDHLEGFQGHNYPTPPDAYSAGCNWPAALTYTIPANWRSGVYAICCNRDQVWSYTPFVVRPARPGKASRILYMVPITTYQAYSSFGGKSLYDGNSSGGIRSSRVSLLRPYSADNGLGQFGAYEQPFTQWMEKSGIVADFCTSIDLAQHPEMLSRYQMLLISGHDEYWSKEMRDAIEGFVASGHNLADFSANTGYWQIRIEDGGRSIVCYKDAASDPVAGDDPSHATVRFRDPPLNRPESQLFGVMYAGNSSYVGKPAVVHDANHWIFEGTTLKSGDLLGSNIVGYEWDDLFPESPSGALTLLSTDITGLSEPSRSVGCYFEMSPDYGFANGRGGKVFAAGTVQWSWGLDDISNAHADPNMQRMTRNIVRNLSSPKLSQADVQVLFRADARALHLASYDAVALVGGNPALGFSSGVSMADNGVGADSVAGDGIYSALVTIPAGTPSPIPYGFRVNNAIATLPATSGLLWVDESLDPGVPQVQEMDRIATPSLVAAPPPPRPILGIRFEAARPNPFRGATTLAFVVPGQLPPGAEDEGGPGRVGPQRAFAAAGAGIPVKLRIYDAAGRAVRTLVDGYMLAGPVHAVWDGRDAAGHETGNGLYFARLDAAGKSATTKLVRIR